MYYPSSESKGADQLRGYREADLRLCFRLCKLLVFSRGGSNCNADLIVMHYQTVLCFRQKLNINNLSNSYKFYYMYIFVIKVIIIMNHAKVKKS